MTRHSGPVLLLVGLLAAGAVVLLLARPAGRDRDGLRSRILEVDVNRLAKRLNHVPESDVTALVKLRERLEAALPSPRDRWLRFAGSDSAPRPGLFRDRFETWLARVRAEEILTPAAWPGSRWRSGERLPTREEMERIMRVALLVEGLGRAMRTSTGGRLTEVLASESADVAEVTLEFEPERAGGLIDALDAPSLGGEPFDVLSLTTTVPETGLASARMRLALANLE